MHNGIEAATKPVLRKLLKHAIANGHVWPAFQPIVNIRTGAISSFEILARWSDPQAGDISPDIFIPRLEQHGLIAVLSEALLEQACRSAADWPGQFTLAFNISPFQLISEDLPCNLVEVIEKTCFPLGRVELEVTEGSLISDADVAYAILREINNSGIRIGIDDFGTGYSSLARLESFPFHKLKIDARFVHGIDTEAGKRRIAAAIIGLGQSLGITVVAEGVETEAEEAILRELGCDQGQGWLYGRGVASEQARCLLDDREVDTITCPLDTSPFQRLHQLAKLYDQAPVGLCFVDLQYRHVRVNERFAEIHGLTVAQLEGRTIYEIMEGDLLEDVIGVMAEAINHDEPVTREYILQGRNVRVLNSRVRDLAGDVIGFSVVAIDVTEENRLKEALARSKKQLRGELDFIEAFLASLPGIFYYYDHEMRLQRWNRNNELVTGYSGAELQNISPLSFFAEEEKKQVEQAMQDVLRHGQSQVEAHLLTRDGQRIPYLFTGARFEHDGHAGFVGTGTDISDSKRMEQALRDRTAALQAVIESLPDGLLLLDAKGNRIVQNRRLDELWKIPPEIAQDAQGERQLDYMSSRVRNPAEYLARIDWLEAHPDEESREIIELLDGTVLRRHTAPLYDGEGHYHGRMWAFRAVASG